MNQLMALSCADSITNSSISVIIKTNPLISQLPELPHSSHLSIGRRKLHRNGKMHVMSKQQKTNLCHLYGTLSSYDHQDAKFSFQMM